MIPYSRQTISQKDLSAVMRVLKSDYITQGPEVARFEAKLARLCQAKFAVAFSSGTAALHGAYFAIGLAKNDEIITSALTFAATANAALWQKARPVFVDINPKSGTLDSACVEKKITKHTKAIVGVDFAGLPCDLDLLKRIAKKHNIFFIEDAAHSLGATYRSKPIGSHADLTMFSFHPVKSITTAEGGAITTNNKKLYDLLLLFRSHGITKNKERMKRKNPPLWYQEMQVLGLNYRLSDIHAALGSSQLTQLNSFIEQRTKRACYYTDALSKIQDIQLPQSYPDRTSAWHLYVIRLKGELAARRDCVFKKLHDQGVGVQVHYLPVYLHPYYQSLGYTKGMCPEAEAFFHTAISLPLYPTLTRKDQNYVISSLEKICRSSIPSKKFISKMYEHKKT